MNDVAEQVGVNIGPHPLDRVQRVGDEEPRGAMIGMLILPPRRQEQRGGESGDHDRKLLREIFTAVLGIGNDDFGSWGAIEARERRAICAGSLRPVPRHQPGESTVGKAQKREGRVTERQGAECAARLPLALPPVSTVIAV